MTYLTHATINRSAFETLVRRGRLDEYTRHQLVWEVFRESESQERDFVFRWEQETQKAPGFYAVGPREPVSDADGIFTLRTRPYELDLREGDELTFVLRANTVVKTRDEDGKQQRHDVVMHRKHELREADEWPAEDLTNDELVRECGLGWLRSRAERNGFSFGDGNVLVNSHDQLDFRKSRNSRRVRLSVMDFEGRLRVESPDSFVDALTDGIGPAKAFGCGLMLVRRA